MTTWGKAYAIRVDGIPAPKGSARAIKDRADKARLIPSGSDGNKAAIKAWCAAVGWSARAAFGRAPIKGPVAVAVRFDVPRLPSVTRARPEVKPDVDKLLRSTFDALTGIAWIDDGQVVEVRAEKYYAQPGKEGAWITITEEQQP